jgi:uncharacterized membrane protein
VGGRFFEETLSIRVDPESERPDLYNVLALLITALLTGAFIVVAALRLPWILIPLGLFVLFVAPGYALAALLFGGEREITSLPLNIALIVGFSLVVDVGIGTVALFFSIGPLSPIVGVEVALLCFIAVFVQFQRRHVLGRKTHTPGFWSWIELPGFTSSQRTTAYVLFVGVLVTFGVIGLLSTLQPSNTPDLSLAVLGPNGTTSTLPSSGSVNSTLGVLLLVQNNATAQSLVLSVNSSLIGGNPAPSTSVPWVLPLQLAPGATSTEVLPLTHGETDSVAVSFQFADRGNYTISFSLTPPQSTVAVRTVGISVEIT